MPFHHKVINSIGSIAKDLILGPSVVKSYKGSTSYTTADATLRARRAAVIRRKPKKGRKRLSPDLSMRKKKGGKDYKSTSRGGKQGLRRSTKPGIRRGITGRTYSGTPMNLADIRKRIAEAKKNK